MFWFAYMVASDVRDRDVGFWPWVFRDREMLRCQSGRDARWYSVADIVHVLTADRGIVPDGTVLYPE